MSDTRVYEPQIRAHLGHFRFFLAASRLRGADKNVVRLKVPLSVQPHILGVLTCRAKRRCKSHFGGRRLHRIRGGLVFKAHRLVCHSTLGVREIKKKKGRAWREPRRSRHGQRDVNARERQPGKASTSPPFGALPTRVRAKWGQLEDFYLKATARTRP